MFKFLALVAISAVEGISIDFINFDLRGVLFNLEQGGLFFELKVFIHESQLAFFVFFVPIPNYIFLGLVVPYHVCPRMPIANFSLVDMF